MGNNADQVTTRIRDFVNSEGNLRRAVYDRLPVNARALVRRAIQKDPLFPKQPKTISVIVPVYNVEEYLHECLRSIVNQTYTNLEIIVVNDGSTDRSVSIAEEFSKSDRRVTVITQPNAGLGAARNTGMDAASGDFIVFSDSDDIVPPDAYKTMVETLLQSGSDFVVGAYWRMTDLRQYVPRWVKDAHAEPIIGATSNDFLLGLANVFAWNKMFRTEFIERIDLRFPEGIRYEDQYPITRAYLLARAFDVIPDKVYKWRIRFDGSSITQNKGSYDDVADRAEVVTSVYEFVNENADSRFREYWIAKVLGMDLIPYISESLHADDDYRDRIHYLIGLLEPHVTEDVRAKIKVRARCALYAFKNGTPTELGHVMLTNNEIGAHLPTRVSDDGQVYFVPQYSEEVSLQFPDELLRLSRDELTVEHAVNRVLWQDQNLVIDGWAFFRNVNLDEVPNPTIRLYLESDINSRRLDLSVEPGTDFVSRYAKSKWPNYDSAAFRAVVPVEKILQTATGEDTLRLYISIDQLEMSETFLATKAVSNGSAGRLEALTTDDGVIITPSMRKNSELKFSITRAATYVEDIVSRSEAIDISARTRAGTPATLTTVNLGRFSKSRELPKARRARRTQLAVKALPAKIGALQKNAELRLQSGTTSTRLFTSESALPADLVSIDGVGVRRNRRSTLEVVRKGPLAYADSVTMDGLSLRLKGNIFDSSSETVEMSLTSNRATVKADEVVVKDGKFSATFTLQINEFGRPRNLPYGGYLLNVSQGRRSSNLLPGRSLGGSLPAESAGNDFRLRLTKTRRGALWLSFGFASTDDETGSLNQARLQRWHREGDFDVMANSVFFQSYLGEQATDSALEIHNELRRRRPELKLYWGVNDPSVSLPEGAIPVVMYTTEWFEILSRAEYLVNNIYFFSWFTKRPYQTYVQTWHGTPLKKIGHSYWEDRNREPVWIERMDRQAAQWDYLVSPNAFCTTKFAEEFNYDGEILETGYPRNDVLSSADDSRRNDIRALLGIPDAKKVILYAPTWRDSQSAKAWVANMVSFIDLQVLSGDLGDEYVILVRGHGHNARAGSTAISKGNVIDVTYYPEVNDLYIAADVAITDYSSVMFDFAVTQKPMLFFVPDLEEYAEGVRGFYLDYTATVPGPIVRNADDVAGEIRRLTSDDWTPTGRYLTFVQEFCRLEDGSAAGRVVDRVWGS